MPRFNKEQIRKWLSDPVKAVEILFGAKLDVFQQQRLRFLWKLQPTKRRPSPPVQTTFLDPPDGK